MVKTAFRCGAAWLLAAFVGLLFLAAGCTCARQADSDGSTTSQIQPDTSTPPPIVNPSDDLPDAKGEDQAAVSAAAGEEEEDAEASGDNEESGDGEESGDDTAGDQEEEPGDEGDDGSGGDDGNGAEDDPADNGEDSNPIGGETEEPDPPLDPVAIFRRSHCGDCHGAERKGTSRGPSLLEIDQYWNADDLVQYLESPVYEAEGNTRLIELGRQYNLVMPPAHLDDNELKALAVWLIEQAVAD